MEDLLKLRARPQALSHDWWRLWDLDQGGPVHCGTLAALAGYLRSPSTHSVRVGAVSLATRTARLYAYGPRCDDGRRLSVSRRIEAKEMEEASEEVRQTLLAAAAEKLDRGAYRSLCAALRVGSRRKKATSRGENAS